MSFEIGSDVWMEQVCRVMRDMTNVVNAKGETMSIRRKILCRECEECVLDLFESTDGLPVTKLQFIRIDALVRSVYNDVLTKKQREQSPPWQQCTNPAVGFENPFVDNVQMQRLRQVWEAFGTTTEI